MDRFQLIELDDNEKTDPGFVPVFEPSVPMAAVATVAAVAATAAPAETITVASKGDGQWGDSTFHNLSDGARASGNVVSAHSLLKGADLDWDPVLVPLRTAEGIEVPSSVGRAVVRSDNRKPIGTVGNRYHTIPHRMLADLADALCGANGARLHYGNAGHKREGALPFIQLKAEPRTIGHDVRGHPIDVRDVITLMTGHDGTLQALATYGANIVVCDNTYAHALSTAKSRGISIRHTVKGIDTLAEAIKIARAATEQGAAFDSVALKLITRRMTDENMRQLASALIPEDTTRAENARGKLMSAWFNSPGAAPGTSWGAAQAVTYYTTHEIATRGDTDRSFGLAVGEGSGADLQSAAWWHLTTDEGEKALQTVKLYRC